MNDAAVSVTQLFIVVMWCIAIALQVVAWIIALAADGWHLAILLAAASLPPLTAAALAQIRVYTLRVCRTIRAARIEPPSTELHRV